jgi:hypothetical protein
MADIDIYEFKKTLKKFESDDFIQEVTDKSVGLIEVGKTTSELDEKLIKMGYKKGEQLLVVIQ